MAEEKNFNFLDLEDPYGEKRYISKDEKADSTFGKLVFEFPQEFNEIAADGVGTDFVYRPQAYFRGASQVPGAEFNQSFQIVVKPYFLDRIPHRHSTDEFLIFLGASYPSVFDFDAKIEFTLGKDDDAETVLITKPTIVRIPAGVYHCPLNFKEVNKPILFLATLFTPMFEAIMDQPDGTTREFFYNGPVQCKYNENKKCDSCGKCILEKWDEK